MLDLQKYAKRAEADPAFRAKLLKNANQAIKDEFGEDLPYALKCKEKLSFEVESMDGLNDGDLESVAGGTPPQDLVPLGIWQKRVEDAGYTLSTEIRKGDTGSHKYYKYDHGMKQSYAVGLVKLNGEWYVRPYSVNN